MRRFAWWALLAAIAAVAVFAQLDRASHVRPQLAPAVPKPFRSFAQVPMTMLAVASGDAAAARREAERLVRIRPMPAEHLFLLALTDLRRGDVQGYARAFEHSTTRGWRAQPVQQAAAAAALARGDAEAAANRVAAMWALDASDPALPELTRSLLSSRRGRRAFARNLAGTKVWQNLFLQRAAEFAPPHAALEVVSQAQREGARFDCAVMRTFEAALAGQPLGFRPTPVACMNATQWS